MTHRPECRGSNVPLSQACGLIVFVRIGGSGCKGNNNNWNNKILHYESCWVGKILAWNVKNVIRKWSQDRRLEIRANHLGLIEAIEGVIRNRLPIISCPKCFTFWSVLIYGLWVVGKTDIPQLLAISFLCSYLALWLELLEAFIDTIYMKCYEKIYNHTTDTPATDADEDSSAGASHGWEILLPM